MVRLLLILIIFSLLAFWLIRVSTKSGYGVRASKSWLKAGGFLGLLILIARITHVPLAQLLRLVPFVIGSFHRATETQAQHAAVPNKSGMTPEEACLILGVRQGASREEILAAHRKLITHNHPDKGGNNYLAAKINEARDVLLEK